MEDEENFLRDELETRVGGMVVFVSLSATPFVRPPQRGILPCSCFGIEKQALKWECTSICWLKLSVDLSTHSSFSMCRTEQA